MRLCAAKEERKRIQRRERMFKDRARGRFVTSQRRKSTCSKLMVDGELVSDRQSLMEIWAHHFAELAKSKVDKSEKLQALLARMDLLASKSMANEEAVLGVPFTTKEVADAVKKLKSRKAAGPDGLAAEHLKEGGGVVILWLTDILNAVMDLEVVPDVLKCGMVVPVYKGGG